jgi:hypothetical protein
MESSQIARSFTEGGTGNLKICNLSKYHIKIKEKLILYHSKTSNLAKYHSKIFSLFNTTPKSNYLSFCHNYILMV